MYFRRLLGRRAHTSVQYGVKRKEKGFTLFLLITSALLLVFSSAFFFQELAADIAVSDACDVVTVSVNRAIAQIMQEEDYSGDYFVTFEKNDTGEVTAISSNMARINRLSAQVLERVVGATDNNTVSVEIPAGNLSGISFLMGKGPKIPVKIIVETTSTVGFNNTVVTAGINQSKHQITLVVNVDVNVLIPWCKRTANVTTEVLIADTVIVGKVPDTYLNVE